MESIENISIYNKAPHPPASVLAFSTDKNRIVWQSGDENVQYPGGLGLPVLTYYFLDLLRKGKLTWNDTVVINGYAAKEAGHPASLGLVRLEKVSLQTLFNAMVVNSSPDATIALAWHIFKKVGKSKNKTMSAIRKIGESWGISESALKNTTGRFYEQNPSYYTNAQMLKVAIHLLSFDRGNFTSVKVVAFGDKHFETSSILGKPPISNHLTFSTGDAINTVCKCEFDDDTVFFAVCGATSALERDQLLLEAMHRARVPLPSLSEDFIATDRSILTICGDTYCGERYTKWRIARNIDDPMQRYGDAGYAYSYEKVAPLISQDSFNIVNSECVLSPVYDEPQQTGKYIDFVLGANPQKTIDCYKKVNINAVMLANNHAMDFGESGCRQTREFFREAGLNPIGTGKNIDEAEEPLLLSMQSGRRVILFNAYCYYTDNRHYTFRHYCLGANTGAAFGTDILENTSLWKRMWAYREKYPDAVIIFSPHWSTDFNKRHLHLRPIAAKAFNAGADIILGHGPHIPIGAEHIGNKLCVYSIGNFVFNTTGIDLDASGQSPYGIVARIDFAHKTPKLKLYPIYAHSLNTFFQPYPVEKDEQYAEFIGSMIGAQKFKAEKDSIGYHLSIDLRATV
ncbi:MAG: CapA family protein [Defluviitaleaceae bacterium]|nr:CapA family protein [Defluviitaleaceae bacterium]